MQTDCHWNTDRMKCTLPPVIMICHAYCHFPSWYADWLLMKYGEDKLPVIYVMRWFWQNSYQSNLCTTVKSWSQKYFREKMATQIQTILHSRMSTLMRYLALTYQESGVTYQIQCFRSQYHERTCVIIRTTAPYQELKCQAIASVLHYK
jgi:hypothetical protein